MKRRLEDEAPTHFEAPTGNRHPIEYEGAGAPALSIRVQELFGLKQHPAIANGTPAADTAPAVARAPAHPDHARSAGLLEGLVECRQIRDEGPLPQAPLARRPGQRNAHRARKAAGDVSIILGPPGIRRGQARPGMTAPKSGRMVWL